MPRSPDEPLTAFGRAATVAITVLEGSAPTSSTCRRRARGKLAASGLPERVRAPPMGERPGRVVADVRTAESFVHSWDVARATGQDTDPDAELAEYVREGRTALSGDRPRAMLPFGEPQEVPVEAAAADRLAAYLGCPVVVA